MINTSDNFGQWVDESCLKPQYTLCQKRTIENCPTEPHTFQLDNNNPLQHPTCKMPPIQLSSPNYPENYPSNLNWDHTIVVPDNALGGKFSFLDFDVEYSPVCAYDSVQVHYIIRQDALRVGISLYGMPLPPQYKYCGDASDPSQADVTIWTNLPFEFVGTSEIKVKFFSDGENNKRGFLFEYYFFYE